MPGKRGFVQVDACRRAPFPFAGLVEGALIQRINRLVDKVSHVVLDIINRVKRPVACAAPSIVEPPDTWNKRVLGFKQFSFRGKKSFAANPRP
jgi:hypothetical protein